METETFETLEIIHLQLESDPRRVWCGSPINDGDDVADREAPEAATCDVCYDLWDADRWLEGGPDCDDPPDIEIYDGGR